MDTAHIEYGFTGHWGLFIIKCNCWGYDLKRENAAQEELEFIIFPIKAGFQLKSTPLGCSFVPLEELYGYTHITFLQQRMFEVLLFRR